MRQLVWVPRSLGSARVERREGGGWMGTYLRNSSRQEPQVPAPQPEIDALEVRGGPIWGPTPMPFMLPTRLSDYRAEAGFAVTLVFS